MKKLLVVSLVLLLVLPGVSYAQKATQQSCRVISTIVNDGSGDNRTKKRGGNYAAIRLDTLKEGQVLKVNPTSGTLKYVTLHARFQGGYWRTLYQGPVTEFPVSKYLAAVKKDPKCTHVNISVNGAHERYEPIACAANIEVCDPARDTDCTTLVSIFNDGTGDNRTKKRGGNYAAIKLDTLNEGQILKVTPTSGTLKYVTLHARFQGGYWRTLYQGPITEFPVSRYLAAVKKDPKCTHVNISVNGAHEKYEPIACKATISVCGKEKASNDHPQTISNSGKEEKIFLKAHNGQFVCAEGGGGREVVANRDQAAEWETFTLVRLQGQNKVALKAYNGQFVCAEDGGGREVMANKSQAGPWETFTLVRLPGKNMVALKAHNGQFFCAEGGGGREVVANRNQPMEWETFTLVNPSPSKPVSALPQGKIALKTYNGQFVCAEGGGGREVVAKRSQAGKWETFSLFKLPGQNKVGLKAYNGQFVSADTGNNRKLVANRAQAGEWETFTLVKLPGQNKVALKALNGNYVCAEDGGGREVVANRTQAREWETFTLVHLN